MVVAVDPGRRRSVGGSIAEALAIHASARPEATALTVLIDGEQETVSLNFGELYLRACALAREIAERQPQAKRAIVLQAPGLEYVVSLCALRRFPPHFPLHALSGHRRRDFNV